MTIEVKPSDRSVSVEWDEPSSGPPTTHYQVNYIHLKFGANGVTNEQMMLIIPPTSTLAVFEDVCGLENSTSIIIITAVSGSDSTSSHLAYIGKYLI